mmetsp:Transcript_52419/g.137244  ORF Transcript_52419/g.137244 Transcript_52419/m.137244 type:complete len:385 (-) Transcript_52419:4933-6087(-)
MLLLVENLKGYGLLRINDTEKKYILRAVYEYKTKIEAIKTTENLIKGKINKKFKNFLKNSINTKERLLVSDIKLKNTINKKLGKNFCKFVAFENVFQRFKNYFEKKITPNKKNDTVAMASHFIYGKKVRFCGIKKDLTITYSIKILEETEKKINFYYLRLKEWYNWHFPELCDLNLDSLTFSRLICEFETRKKLKVTDITHILNKKDAFFIKKAAQTSIGCDFEKEDFENIVHLSHQIISIYEFKEIVRKYLKNKMYIVAPNLTTIVGDRIGAKLISYAKSIFDLAKYPSSTIQLFGAEKAMFKAKKNKTPTPKFGIIYNCSIVKKASSSKNKGKLSRMISAKIALAVRADTLKELKYGGILGIKNRHKIEKRLEQLESFNKKN